MYSIADGLFGLDGSVSSSVVPSCGGTTCSRSVVDFG